MNSETTLLFGLLLAASLAIAPAASAVSASVDQMLDHDGDLAVTDHSEDCITYTFPPVSASWDDVTVSVGNFDATIPGQDVDFGGGENERCFRSPPHHIE